MAYLKTEYKIVAINVNSITSVYKKMNLENFLQQNNIDICLLTETKMNETHSLEIPNYTSFVNNRKNKRARDGGTAILVKEKKMDAIETQLPLSTTNKIIEHTIIKSKLKINNKLKQQLFIVSLYATNKTDTKNIFI